MKKTTKGKIKVTVISEKDCKTVDNVRFTAPANFKSKLSVRSVQEILADRPKSSEFAF